MESPLSKGVSGSSLLCNFAGEMRMTPSEILPIIKLMLMSNEMAFSRHIVHWFLMVTGGSIGTFTSSYFFSFVSIWNILSDVLFFLKMRIQHIKNLTATVTWYALKLTKQFRRSSLTNHTKVIIWICNLSSFSLVLF